MKKTIDNRLYSFEVILYCDRSDIIHNIKNVRYIKHYLISPLHDLDIAEDGSFKKPHTHVFCTFVNKLSFDTVARLFSSALNCSVVAPNVGPIRVSLRSSYEYSFHLNEDHSVKPLYNRSDVVSDKLRYFANSYAHVSNEAYSIITDLEENTSLRSMAMKYGRDFIIHYSHYKDFTTEMIWQEKGEVTDDDDPF